MNTGDQRHEIVVGADGSEPSIAAIRWAARQAQLTGAELHVVHAWRRPYDYGMPVDYSGADFETQARDCVKGAIAKALDDDRRVPVSSEVVQGPAAAVLIEAARHAELLVIGSRGHGAFAGMLLGSVSQHCVQHAHCPVLVVRGSG
ncbi:universal stress protein [Kribbella speibonae]|uniref:Universal stress protein n=1 Tax=Kribbella speibonae TaxID=1572660 RepID=A0ABY2AAZ0_9ACTN|nr:universal stress protein [Kribbella speibonae]